MSWVPTTDFEEEIVSLQPRYNFIYGTLGEPEPEEFYPRPKAHLEYAAKKKREKQNQNAQSEKLKMITKVQNITHTKPLGEQPAIEDWDNNDNIEKETIAMMRHFGIGPSLEESMNENFTLPTLPITEDMHIMQSGSKRIPIFFHEKYFKLKPRNPDPAIDVDDPSSSIKAVLASVADADSASNSSLSENSHSSKKSGTNVLTSAVDKNVATTSILSAAKSKNNNISALVAGKSTGNISLCSGSNQSSNSNNSITESNSLFQEDTGFQYELLNDTPSTFSSNTDTSQFETAVDEIDVRSITSNEEFFGGTWYRKNSNYVAESSPSLSSSSSSFAAQHNNRNNRKKKQRKAFVPFDLYDNKDKYN